MKSDTDHRTWRFRFWLVGSILLHFLLHPLQSVRNWRAAIQFMRPYKRAHALSQSERYDEAIPLWLEAERLLTANPKGNDPGVHAFICEHIAYALYQVKDLDRYRIYDKKKNFLKSEAAKLDKLRGQNEKGH